MTTESAAPAAKSKLRYFTVVARLLMALVFLPAGAMFFLGMMPEPKEPPPPAAMEFFGAMMKTGYLFHLVKATEAVAGLLFLVNRFVPLALAIIAPVLVNICFVNVKLAPTTPGVVTSAVIIVLELYLVWAYRAAFRPLFTAKFPPTN
jgi:uncharacterized membrane protein YphA (DoxX/SURF4 family)